MANNTDPNIPAVDDTQAPVKATAGGDYGFVTIPKGKQIAVTDDGIGGEHPYEQPNDPNSLAADGDPKGPTSDKYNPAAAWVQSNGGHAEVVIVPGRSVLVNLRSVRIAHKLQTGELVRCDQAGKAL